MNNIPMFTGANGMATLILREIPLCGRAYVLIRSVWNDRTEALLEECAQFCRAAGAREIYVSDGRNALPAEPAHTVLELSVEKSALPLPEHPVPLVPLSKENSQIYLDIYNRCFRDVVGTASYDYRDINRLLGKDLAFLAMKDQKPAGIAELGDNYLEGVAVDPAFRGLGRDLTLTALARLPGPVVKLKVHDCNTRALNLYRRLCCWKETVVSYWWKIG